MSKVKNDSARSGILGEQSSVRQIGRRMVVKSRPQYLRDKPTSLKEKDVQLRFYRASQYAVRQTEDPAFRELYAKRITDKKRTPYMVAMSDYLISPEVESIDTIDYRGKVDDLITIMAKDDFMVTRVKVKIYGTDGALIEEGDASADPLKVDLWEYKAKTALAVLVGTVIRAIAYDRPGNTGVLEVTLDGK